MFISLFTFLNFMGLLNHLFENKKHLAKGLVMGESKRIKLWQEHLTNYKYRKMLTDPVHSDSQIDTRLYELKAGISSELISINKEEKTEKEIIADLKKLRSFKEIEKLTTALANERRRQATILKIFQEIHNILKTELHLIKLIEKKPSNVRDLFKKLFVLVHKEDRLYEPFILNFFEDNSIHEDISRLTNAVLLGVKSKKDNV